ncbi:energy transducer TonB [Flavobacterium luteum]|uniref:Gliding motility protein RemB n=1 Tax=Flavobacterium luteum TaxID=2026654 RepID=A0A7J5AF36_9FLAO|nr:gliding motility protein RemB [Flavobacterium luteum]KAB1156207.1 gliding motility protein RemB [Flavobacterium luteum]
MNKYFSIFLFLGYSTFSNAQVTTKNAEQFPVFSSCENQYNKDLETCFYTQVQDFIFNNFKVPENLSKSNFKGNVIVLFEVDENGKFNVQYVDAVDNELVKESKRVFKQFPQIGPPTFNGTPTYSKYSIKIAIPPRSQAEIAAEADSLKILNSKNFYKNRDKELIEYDSIVYHKFKNPKFESHLNIPFSHSYYAQFDAALNQLGANNHTSSKPFTYAEVSKYYNLKEVNAKLLKKKSGWWGRKIWNENTVEIQGEGYWFTMNPIFDLQTGISNPSISKSTYVNTRGLQIQGGLGEQLNFTTTIYESQGRFADYFNDYARSIKPSGGNPAVIPGIGIAKSFKADSFDMPLAEANLIYTPNKFINLQLGYGRNFIGDGYRSLITTDGVSPLPFFKINTTFWKIKYTNTYMFLKDIRTEATVDKTYTSKYMANHYLSWNATKRWNIGFFESVVWANVNNRGFDASFINPIIFYRSVEFASSNRTGNALLGLTSKYKFNNQINGYVQFLVDEFSLSDIKARNQSWKNKFGYQLGVKYFNAFNVENLLLQLEWNHVRPYVYSHSDPLTNYAHSNQSLGHQWGGNFKEFIFVARYHKGRYFADAKITSGTRGLDFNTTEDSYNYGGDIYKDYEENRFSDTNVKVGQGNKTDIFIADIQGGYLINPQTNLKLFGSFIFRNFNPNQETATAFKNDTTWFSLGLRSDIFNWYFDY